MRSKTIAGVKYEFSAPPCRSGILPFVKLLPFLVALSAFAADVQWPVNGGPDNIRYSPLKQITPQNVARLAQAWRYDSHDEFQGSEMQCNPIVVDGILYATTPKMRVIALDAATGRELWAFDPNPPSARARRVRNRGVTVHQDRVFFTYTHELWAVDRKTGKPIVSFGDNGRVDLRQGLGRPAETLTVSASSPGVIFEDMIVLGSTVPETLPGSPGHIRAYDVKTGKQRWIFHTIPQPGEFGYDTWPKDAYKISGGVNAWAGLAVDAQLGMIFAATGSASFDFYGANRVGDNLFANCVLALDARTGKRVWHFQAIKHDVWDYDFPAAPSLVTVNRNGRKVAAVAQITKYGYVYVFDRKTGEPLFPIEYRKVPASPVDGEKLSEVQPYPVKPPPYARQILTEDMLTNRTPEAHAAVLDRFHKINSKGMFYPPTTEGTIIFPGFDGGGEWGGAAFDPATSLLYVNSNELPWVLRLVPRDQKSAYLSNCATCHRDDRAGTPPNFPSLIGIADRRSKDEIVKIIREGAGRMPGFSSLGAETVNAIADFLVTGKETPANADPNWLKYRSDGYNMFLAPDGLPAITPPWGTLNAIDLDKGEIRWTIPLGEIPKTGLKNTGSDNYGGPVVTAAGLLFIGATNHDKKFRVFDSHTGKILWETDLPAAGNATPAMYEIKGKQYIVIPCGGGKNGAPSGGSFVAFALP
jgi:quinoprotein glucose dehydrogenase